MTGAPEKYVGNGGIGVPCSQFAHTRCPARRYSASLWDAVSAYSSRSDNPACTAGSGHRLNRRRLRYGRPAGPSAVPPPRPRPGWCGFAAKADADARDLIARRACSGPGDASRVTASLPPARYVQMRLMNVRQAQLTKTLD